MKKTVGIYIHIPFCISKCNYCDFNSYSKKFELVKKYIDYLKKEINLYKETLEGVEIRSIFLGGGTPTSIDSRFIVEILNEIFKYNDCSNIEEITIEGNPGTFTEEKIKTYKSIGINRISMGVQSFDNKLLKVIGRSHLAEDVISSYNKIIKAGYDNISIDLMYGLPNQTKEDLMNTLKEAVKLKLKHISLYGLIVEKGTKLESDLNNGLYSLPSEDEEREMCHEGIKFLEENEYYQYEISNFSKIGFESKHNLCYWKVTEFIGFGLSSSSDLNGKRYSNLSDFEDYFEAIENNNKPIDMETFDEISSEMEQAEYIILGLRLNEGINKDEFKRRYGEDIETVYGDIIKKHSKQGLLHVDDKHIRFTQKGQDLSNIVLCEFIPES